MTATYAGVNAALLTAVDEAWVPDLDRTAAHARWCLSHGCDGLGVLGTTGEANSFGVAERRGILEGLVARGIPAARMLPGTGTTNLADTVELTRHARELGCPGVLVLPPFYYKNPGEDGLFAYFAALAERAPGVKLYLYHFPQQSAVPIPRGLVARLLEAFPGVVAGMKDSSGDFDHTAGMIRAFGPRGFEVYGGADDQFARLLELGAAGCITAATNLTSRFAAEVYRHRTGPQAEAAQGMMAACRRAAATVPLIPGLHEILARSLDDPGWRNIRPPHLPLSPEEGARAWVAWKEAGGLPLPGLAMAQVGG